MTTNKSYFIGLTADRTMMSEYHAGSINIAPCGTRKIEAALIDYGYSEDDIIIAYPEHLEKVIGPKTKVVGVTENDPL